MRKTLLVLGILIAVPIGIYYYLLDEHLLRQERAAYERRLAEIRAAGDPVTSTDVRTEWVPHAENAAILLKEAHTLLERLHGTPAGEAYGFTEWDDWDDEDHARFDCYMQAAQPYRDLVERALRRPGWCDDYRWSEAIREHYTWLVRTDRVVEGRTERAAHATLLLLGYADKIPLAHVSAYVDAARMRVSSLDPLRDACTRPGFDAALYRKLVDPGLARAEQARGPPAAVLKAQRAGVSDWVTAWFTRDSYSSGIRTELTLYRTANAKLDAYAHAIALADAEPGTGYDAGPHKTTLARAAHEDARRAFSAYAAEVTALRLGRIVAAVLEHKQANGMWPEALPADAPLNPFTGQPFAYERTGDGVRLPSWDLD